MIGAKLSTKGQTTIPKEVRDYLRLSPGDRVLFVIREGEVLLQPVTQTLLDLRGSIKPRRRPEDFDAVRQEVKKRVSRKLVDA
jgi:AbrB family looped-hinge helix DNA binding protein